MQIYIYIIFFPVVRTVLIFFRYAEMPTSDINLDVFATFKDLLKTHVLVFWGQCYDKSFQ